MILISKKKNVQNIDSFIVDKFVWKNIGLISLHAKKEYLEIF